MKKLCFILLVIQLNGVGKSCALPLHIVNNNKGPDTSYVLSSFVVTGLRYKQFFTGSKLHFLDSTALQMHQGNSLATLLANNSMIFIKSYGPGMLATPGFRGGNANHTGIIWNGFNMQQSGTGQYDLSLLPSFLMEDVTIQYGSPSALFGSGNIGGAIHLQSRKNLQPGLHIEAMAGKGSFSTYHTGAKVFLKQGNFEMQQKLYYQESENNFTYIPQSRLQPQFSQLNPVTQTITSNHSAFRTQAWVQDYQYQSGGRHLFHLSTWLQDNQRNIPNGFGTPLNAEQQDQTFKVTTEYQFTQNRYQLHLRYGCFADKIAYTDQNTPWAITHAVQQTGFIDQFYQSGKWQFQGSLMVQQNQSKMNSLPLTWYQNRTALFGSVKWNSSDNHVQHQVTLRQEWTDKKMIPFMPSYGLMIRLPGKRSVYGNLSRSYRLPTFNDLYWPGMGNPLLQPETGWNQELSYNRIFTPALYTIKGNRSDRELFFSNTFTVFNKQISNWIIWVPQGGSLSKPMNIYKVWSRGLEYTWMIQYKTRSKTIYKITGMHDYTVATIESSAIPNDAGLHQQLIFTPRVKHRLQFTMQKGGVNLNVFYNHVGTRYVSSDHANWLDPYQYWTVSSGYKMLVKEKEIYLQLLLNNILNQSYQVMVNQPMPMFNYQINLTIKI